MASFWFIYIIYFQFFSAAIKEAIESVIGGNTYLHNKVNQWSSSIMDSCLQSLVKLQKPFKYIGKMILNDPQILFENIYNFYFDSGWLK